MKRIQQRIHSLKQKQMPTPHHHHHNPTLPFTSTLQYAYCKRELGLPDEKVNPNGGAIALGHPIGEPAEGLAKVCPAIVSLAVATYSEHLKKAKSPRSGWAWLSFGLLHQSLAQARPSAGCSGARQTVTLLHELARRNNSGEKHEVGGYSFVAQVNYAGALGRASARVVSCNTTALSRISHALDRHGWVKRVRAVLLRRASDPWESHLNGMINTAVPETKVPSHQGPDAQTVLPDLDITTLAGAGPFNLSHLHFAMVETTRPVFGSIFWIRLSAIWNRCLPSKAVPAWAWTSIESNAFPSSGSIAVSLSPAASQTWRPS